MYAFQHSLANPLEILRLGHVNFNLHLSRLLFLLLLLLILFLEHSSLPLLARYSFAQCCEKSPKVSALVQLLYKSPMQTIFENAHTGHFCLLGGLGRTQRGATLRHKTLRTQCPIIIFPYKVTM